VNLFNKLNAPPKEVWHGYCEEIQTRFVTSTLKAKIMKSVHSLEENSSSRPRLVMVAFLLSIGLLATAPSAQAISFDFTSDHVTGGAGTPPFGTVTLTQVGTSVDVTVHLATGYSFVKTGSADFQNFKFNATGVTLSDITIIQNHQPFVLLPATGAFNGDGPGISHSGSAIPFPPTVALVPSPAISCSLLPTRQLLI